MPTFRMGRINKELAREIANLLEFEMKDEAVKSAVITSVDCSRDLKQAKVWFTTLLPGGREKTLEALKSASVALRKIMGGRMHLRTTPQLDFRIDTSEDYGRHIDSILDSLNEKNGEE